MAYIDTENIPLHMPVPGSREPAQIALLNENCVVLSTHDHTNGKALAVGRLRSGLQANRPAASAAGNVYFATDTGIFSVDTGTAWVQFLTSGGAATVTGWTLVDPIIRDTLLFGPEPTGTADATIARTGAGALRVDTHLGVGVNPASVGAGAVGVTIGQGGMVVGATGTPSLNLSSNSYWNGSVNTSRVNAGAATLLLDDSGAGMQFRFLTAPAVAPGTAQTLTERLLLSLGGSLGLGVVPKAWSSIYPAMQIGQTAALYASTVSDNFGIGANTYFDGTSPKAIVGGSAIRMTLSLGAINVEVTPSLAANAVQTFTQRYFFGNLGKLDTYPAAGSWALQSAPVGGSARAFMFGFGTGNNENGAVGCYNNAGGGVFHIQNGIAGGGGGHIDIYAAGGHVRPFVDNAMAFGTSTQRWVAIYAVAGAINTCSAEIKEIVGEMDDALALEQLMGLPAIYRFHYKRPVYIEGHPETEDGKGDFVEHSYANGQEGQPLELEVDTSMEFIGPVAEEMPPDMKVGDVVGGNVNTEGHLMASLRGATKEYRAQIAALTERIAALEAANA